MSPTRSGALNPNALRRMAGPPAFERGENYFAEGRVHALTVLERTASAKVVGSREYRVKVWIEDDVIESSCTCPVGRDGAFCKHGVAVGLAWLEETSIPKARASKSKKPKATVTMEDARAHLAGQEKKALVEMLMEQATTDDRLRRRLLMKASRTGPGAPDLAAYRAAIDDAIDTGGFVEYGEAKEYAQGIEDTIDSIEELLEDGHAAEVIDLAEHALAAVEEACGSIDDSDGHLGSILERLQGLHLDACRKARPEPEKLARRLFEWELKTELDTFFGAADTYAGVLGTKGLAAYRRLAEAEWARVPALEPGRDDPEKFGKRFRITHIMETLARRTGDVEAVVAVKKRDLSSPYDYFQIAEAYRGADKHDLALGWAERGIKAFPTRQDPRLRELLAQEYHQRERHEEAMALVWAGFTESPGLDRYRDLKRHADRVDAWPVWREKALSFLRKTTAKGIAAERPVQRTWISAGRSDLVKVFLWEKDVEAAWREAKEGGCSNDLWLTLAAKREKKHPEEVLLVYQAQVEPALGRKNKEAYREAIGLLRKIHGLMARLGQQASFASYVESVRTAHRLKRNFVKLLERVRWG